MATDSVSIRLSFHLSEILKVAKIAKNGMFASYMSDLSPCFKTHADIFWSFWRYHMKGQLLLREMVQNLKVEFHHLSWYLFTFFGTRSEMIKQKQPIALQVLLHYAARSSSVAYMYMP